MTASNWSAAVEYAGEAGTPRSLVVLVDGSPAARGAVDLALRLARLEPSEIVLVDVLPSPTPEDEPSHLVVSPAGMSALRVAAGSGDRTSPLAPVAADGMDAEMATANRLRTVLLPLKGAVNDAGVDASLRLIHGDGPDDEIRRQLTADGVQQTLVLPNPLDLAEPFRAIVTALMLDPPCTVYLAGRAEALRVRAVGMLSKLMRRVWRSLAR